LLLKLTIFDIKSAHYTPFSKASSGLPDTPIFVKYIGKVKIIVWKKWEHLSTHLLREK